MGRRASPNAVLLARAQVFRRQVASGRIDGLLALSYTIDPTFGIRQREAKCPDTTLRQRAYDNGRA